MKNSQYVTGTYYDDKDLIQGINKIQNNNILIFDVRTPFPVHGLDDVLQFKRSRLPRLGFIAGGLGGILAFFFQAWIFTTSWPINFGGKPFLSVPSFIPVTFEMAVLFAAIALVFGFLIKSKIGPGAPTFIFEKSTTDDTFLVIIKETKETNGDIITKILRQAGAQEIRYVNPSSKNA